MLQVFTMLSGKLSNTLENLSLSFCVRCELAAHIENIQDSLNVRLNLPKVKKLKISIESSYCLDFLLGMRDNLEDLTIHCDDGKFTDYKYIKFSLELKARI